MVDGNLLSLSVGGIKAFNLEPFHNRKGVMNTLKSLPASRIRYAQTFVCLVMDLQTI